MSDLSDAMPDPGTDTADAPMPARRGILRRFRRDRKGVAAIEFALLALPFFLMIFAAIETSIVCLAEMTLDQAVDQVGRTVRTGQAQKANLTKDAFKQQICAKVGFLLACDKLSVDVATYDNFAAIPEPLTNGKLDTSGFGYAPGGKETITAVRAFYKWPITTDMMRKYLADGGEKGDGTHLLYAISAFRTEPF
ncbi:MULTISPECIES: TadE/TadG family type IV pilus assembly protein [unclassified Aureimonas]|uniref:TadE/TadG family type IV pilus assembly protein n=1 Tax=unclassified Aureimonas TaxID=2615206 RepID=UPI0006F8FC14|nr:MULTISPECIES: TadE/TadG family type IV pilus assembly protein [unclassified Aureimonas]KQT53857.1 hypothetical protein ASG62_11470 [Aureimonas sp. Leaf427]KQT71702.1 hypothetical protein ASG54_19690 [Aureimonas sp. Leaf460]